jgi:hypothetical protein
MSLHITNDPSLHRPGFVYDDSGVGVRQDRVPSINWKHIDGPLLYTSDAGLHWLTYWERIKLFLGLTDVATIDRARRR